MHSPVNILSEVFFVEIQKSNDSSQFFVQEQSCIFLQLYGLIPYSYKVPASSSIYFSTCYRTRVSGDDVIQEIHPSNRKSTSYQWKEKGKKEAKTPET